MRRTFTLALCALAAIALPACDDSSTQDKPVAHASPALPASNATAARFNDIAEQYYDDYLALHPLEATRLGDHRYDGRFGDYASVTWLADSLAIEQESLQKLERIDRNRLAAQERLGLDAFKRQREINVEGYRYPTELLPADQIEALPLQFAWLGSGQGAQPFRTARNYDDFLARMDGFVAWVDQTINNLRSGVAKGVVEPRPVVERLLPPLLELGVRDPKLSVFWGPILNFPAGLSVAERRRFIEAYGDKLGAHVLPAYRRLHDFLQREYLPHARAPGSMAALPNGEAWYAYLVRYHTGTTLTPGEVHTLGLREVARVHADLEHLKAQLGGGDLRTFLGTLHADPQFHPDTPANLLAGYAALRERVNSSLQLMFPFRPRSALVIRAVEPFRAPFAPSVEYVAPPAGDPMAGVLYVNTTQLAARPRYLMEAQFLADALPGRHLQEGLAAEATRLPRFQRHGAWDTAYREGWAAYARTLGRDLGLYTDGYSQLGDLLLQARLAARVVVDTGVHAQGWTRAQALEYLRANAGLDDVEAAAELDATLAHPGEVLGGVLGRLEIEELRRRAQQRLGERFDIREFHAQVLGSGVLPLAVLEEKIDRWVTTQAR